MKNSRQKIVIVTGASRGVGKGIALALGATGAMVYVTGRSVNEVYTGRLSGTVAETAKEIDRRGGTGVAVLCDHRNDKEIEALVARVSAEQEGRVDVLVNNVFAVPDDLLSPMPFWQRPRSHWDDMIGLGLRAHYIATCAVAPMMVSQQSGLIVNVSSPGARCYIHSPVYGIGKAGTDKMMHDVAKELSEFNVAALSLWLGVVMTERTTNLINSAPEAYEALSSGFESPEYAGRVISALVDDSHLMRRSGRSWYTSELGKELKVADIDDRYPASYRSMLGGPAEPSAAMIR